MSYVVHSLERMAEQSLLNPPAEPPFLPFLLTPNDQKHDCFFMVGNRQLVEPKRFGAVKMMLMAHSEVLRLELDDSELAERGVVPVVDLYPDTFINLLKYVYGYDNTANLRFEDADNLLYAAEKYMMEPLKARLSSRLMTLLTPDNICHLLNNPACYGTLELKSAITRILQYETDRVLHSHAFLDLDQAGFIKILEQESMNVEEIQVWKAAVKWGKRRGGTEEGTVLREHLSEPLKQIRVCTISLECFVQEVVPTNIINDESVKMVCLYHGKNEKQRELVQVSNETKPRSITKSTKSMNPVYVKLPITHVQKCLYSFVLIYTKRRFGVELLPLEFAASDLNNGTYPVERLTYECNCIVEITEITDHVRNTSTKSPLIVRFCKKVEYESLFQVPLTSNGENIRLLPNTKYKLSVRFTERHTMYVDRQGTVPLVSNEHMEFEFLHLISGVCYSPVKGLRYRPIQYD